MRLYQNSIKAVIMATVMCHLNRYAITKALLHTLPNIKLRNKNGQLFGTVFLTFCLNCLNTLYHIPV